MKASLRIAGVYALFGCLWILFSDLLLESMISDPARLSDLQTFKGWFFVIVTSAMLFALVWRHAQHMGRIRHSLQMQVRQYSDLVENLREVIYEADTNGNFTFINEAWSEATGWTVNECLGRSVLDYIHPEDRERSSQNLRRILEDDDRFVQNEIRIRTASSRYRWFSTISRRATDDTGRVVGLSGSAHDITEQHQAEMITRVRETYLDLVDSVAKSTDTHLSADDVISRMLASVHTLFPDYRIAYSVVDNAGQLHVTHSLEPDNMAELKGLTADLTVAPEYLRRLRNQPVVAISNVDDSSCMLPLARAMKAGGTRAVLDIGLDHDDSRLGLLCLDSPVEHHWTDDEITLLRDVANYLTVLIRDAQVKQEQIWAMNELKRNEELFRTIVENAPVMINVYDADGACLVWNEESEKIFGYSHDEIIRMESLDGLLADGKENKRTLTTNFERQDGIFREVVAKNKAGDETTQMWANFPLPDGGTVGVGYDITERKAFEQELRASRQRLQLHLQNSPLGVIEWDYDVGVVSWNSAAQKIFGYSTTEAIGQSAFELIGIEEEFPKMRAIAEELRHGSKNNRAVSRNKTKDGRIITCVWYNTALLDENGSVFGFASLVQDITESVQREKQLQQLSAAVTQSANMVCITDTAGIIEYVNPQFSRCTGYGLLEAIGQPANILRSHTHEDEFYENMWRTIKSGQTWTGKIRNRRKNGELYWERMTISPILDENEKIVNYLAIKEDITNEVEAEQKLIESDKLAAVGMLAAGVSHEFKNYLGGIIGNASFALEQLEDEDDPELARETLRDILEMGDRANQVAMSLLSYSRADTVDRTPEDLADLAARTLELVRKELRSRNIEVLTYAEPTPPVRVTAGKIQQLLLNLLINAEQAIDNDGVITITLTHDDTTAYLRVGDTGGGIPRENLQRIFDPFFSTKGVWGKDDTVGTGMGLAICQNIAREHGGSLTVQSMLGVGSTFCIELPLDTQLDESATTRNTSLGHRKILAFSTDKSLMPQLFDAACQAGMSIQQTNSFEKVRNNLTQAADYAILDGAFAGKVELLAMAEACQAEGIPYLIINARAMKHLMAEVGDQAVAVFPDIPEFERIATRLNEVPAGARRSH